MNHFWRTKTLKKCQWTYSVQLVCNPCLFQPHNSGQLQAELNACEASTILLKKETITLNSEFREAGRCTQTDPLSVYFSKLCHNICLCLHLKYITYPSISVGVRSREQGMENNDCFIQIPNEHALRKERAKSMAHSACKMIWLSIRRVHRFMRHGISRYSALMVTIAPRNCGKNHHWTIHLLPPMH